MIGIGDYFFKYGILQTGDIIVQGDEYYSPADDKWYEVDNPPYELAQLLDTEDLLVGQLWCDDFKPMRRKNPSYCENPVKCDVTPEQEANSRYGVPYENARTWYWKEISLPTRFDTGVIGSVRAITEMEALDRLREAFPLVGTIKWTAKPV